ncbi:LysR family transcriptional regulator [Ancylobacter sp. Lp-2]|uniref:LysR family transcriptional regulator n=1 Tax=Ancylobacter sp. Lp-2 TaxID=2881339 RepID=UPI001E4BED2E|nr:LysR family transcriptional regulator [Ancylobacter sp. Lp-2]MCB4768706.1 LysR family transcriptional regulator [Ancylobacter sp. Lp-2]
MQEFLDQGGFDDLLAFVAVADTGSFVLAAQRLGRDASTVSRRVGKLERRLGVRLLSRTTRRVALTEIGAAYHHRLQAVLDELNSAGRDASERAATPQGLVRVSLPMSFGRLWIAPLIPGFLARHPQIRVDLRTTDRYVDLIEEGFDVAIRVGTLPDSSLTARRIATYRSRLVAAPAYLARRAAPQRPEELAEHDCLGFTALASWPDWPLARDGERVTVRPSGPLVSDSSEILLLAALEGVGIGLFPDWLAGPPIGEGRLVEVLPGWVGTIEAGVHAVMPPGRLVPAKVRLFVDDIAEALKAGWRW